MDLEIRKHYPPPEPKKPESKEPEIESIKPKLKDTPSIEYTRNADELLAKIETIVLNYLNSRHPFGYNHFMSNLGILIKKTVYRIYAGNLNKSSQHLNMKRTTFRESLNGKGIVKPRPKK